MPDTVSPVPFNDLSRTPAARAEEIAAAISDVLASGWYVMGPQHDRLQVELAEYLGVSDAVLVGNGTDALELGLAALGVAQGDLVLTAANAGAYTSVATRLLGATPVYADISAETMLVTPETLEESLARLDQAPKAFVITHLYGALARVEELVAVAHRHGIAVLEDCAQSIGARFGARAGGTFGDIATTSFYPTKNLGALGDGGAVFTDRPELAESVRRMRQYGWDSKYHVAHDHGRNSRMDEMQAAILRVKLPHLDAANARRREIHAAYETAGGAATLVNSASGSFNAHLAVLTSESRDRHRLALRERGIGTDVHYPIPDHRQSFPGAPAAHLELPVTDWAAGVVFSVPMFPELTDDEVSRVCDALASL
ncbi:DegT/DnrJ/EryC1/StrS family aminotransferase [Leifsonia poae]|uniref:DegT/DnrJ/EryC1/StrS family aminotransferase n=1 Tax=Leifsonia poae TaxID=110933 RepID=UPI001CBEB3B6|nr:DegT/DnrJ/EryC1/StrS family aminotransferase [Leifsonia poae]